MNSSLPLPADCALDSWARALRRTFDDAVQLLQAAVFEDGWVEIRAGVDSDEAALRASVVIYERALADLFGTLRASGFPADAVAWSTLKAELRRAAHESGVEITLRTGLENALYAAEQVPLGDHAAYRAWALALVRFLTGLTVGAPPRPDGDDTRLDWAYDILAPLEDAAAFQAVFAAACANDRAAVQHQARLLALPRFDLVLNAALWWVATPPPTPPPNPLSSQGRGLGGWDR
jgi:hypothetical protein